MGEIKSVKVDNWGVFFLQKLQNFFNKTDYCDLTLQFRDNSQLKVHRLVLSACTDYFNVLEQTCEVVDDAIIMPNGLQADVVVPIVNFMYTGTLEFELKMYNRLLRTAKDMNMTVLLKLLEAHRRTMEMHPQKNQAPSSPKTKRKIIPSYAAGSGTQTNVGGRTLVQPTAKRIIVSGNNPPQQHRMGASSITYPRSATGNVVSGTVPVKQQIGSTTFTRIKQEAEHEGGYTLSKKSVPQQATPSSPFEQLRKGYTNNNKRPPTATFVSPPAKKPNIEDVKEFAEQQRMRKQIAAEFGDDGDYDAGIMDDDTIHNDDDDDDMATTTMPSPQQAQQHKNTSTAVQTSSTQQQQTEDPPGTTTIIVKNEGPDKPPTIVVKDSSNSKMNHAKIISEVLRQYPHLVNSNKNIKLKIMPNAGGQSQKVIVKKEPTTESDNANAPTVAPQQTKIAIGAKSDPKAASAVQPKPKQQTGNATSVTSSVDQTTNKTADSTTGSAAAVAPQAAPAQKRRIDSKTMHALIALGAENTTGPWLCLRCGRNGHPISIPSYRGFRRHLINTHKETIDPALCEHCGWRSSSKRELHFHMQLEHKIRTNLYIFPECQLCQQMCIDSDALNQHLIDSHPDENKQQCIYCNKIFPEELQLYTHMKTFHKKQALEDGIIDYSDDENVNAPSVFPPPNEDEEMLMEEEIDAQQDSEKKVKILSDISLPIASSIMKTDSFASENVTAGESTTSAASEEYLQEQGGEHMETKFVAADGSEVILTDEQRKEILSQLNQEHDGSGVVMVLNENQQLTTTAETQSEQGAISHDETSQATTATTNDDPEQDDSHIYSEIKSQTSEAVHEDEEEDTVSQPPEEDIHGTEEQQKPKGGKVHHDQQMEESKESIDDLEWAENLISEHEMADHTSESPKPEIKDNTEDDISRKLKELAGEWSEDEDLDEEMEEKMPEEKMEEECLDDDVNKVVDEVPETAAPAEEDKQLVDEDIETTNVESNEIENEDKEKDKDEEVAEGEEVKESETKIEDDNIAMEEDDVDLALKNLHKEGDDGVKAEEEAINESSEKANEPKTVEDVIGNIAELEKVTEEDKETEVDDTDKDRIPTEEDKVTTTSTNDEASKKEDTEATETAPDATVVSNIDEEEKSSVTVKEEKNTADCSTDKISEDEPPVEDEFLAISPEKTKNLSPDESAASTTAEKEPDAQTTSTKTDPNPISSEERVKSLISEWGDDDDEEENETNIATPSL
ncbi:centrosome-associated zinc finger protein Cp190 [Musca vetustissima]|uniref:centrosome-associated zinc finger protein Cp190 n=1 Tax=Musca vetustissima TaxID=27455 RepID=UPI002AB60C94|nr:centrosome-associated zinc finger protein Cp190 [Musca vetustissima]